MTETASTDENSLLVEPAGKFRIYLGAAAGVGKTVAMLDEGLRRLSRGTDVVIGFMESHDRPFTQKKAEGLELVPRKTVNYKGRRFESLNSFTRTPKEGIRDLAYQSQEPSSLPTEKISL